MRRYLYKCHPALLPLIRPVLTPVLNLALLLPIPPMLLVLKQPTPEAQQTLQRALKSVADRTVHSGKMRR